MRMSYLGVYSADNTKLFFSFSLLALLWTLFILSLGAQPGSEQDVTPILTKIIAEDVLRELLPQWEFWYGNSLINTAEPYDFIQFLLRKGAHFVFYGILALIIVEQQLHYRLDPARAFFLAFLFLGLLAGADELLQSFNPGRSGMFLDVILDMCGSSLALIRLLWSKPGAF